MGTFSPKVIIVQYLLFSNTVLQFIKQKIKTQKDSITLYVGNSVITLFNFFTLAILSHFLNESNYGIYRYLLTVTTLTIALGSLGFSNALYYYLNLEDSSSSYKHLHASRLGLLITSIISILLLKVFAMVFYNTQDYFHLLTFEYYIYAIIFLGIMQSIELSAFIYLKSVKTYLVSTFITLGSRIAFLIYGCYHQWELIQFIQVIFISSLISFILNQILIELKFENIKRYFNWNLIKMHLQYGLPIGLGIFFGVLTVNADKIILTLFYKDPAQLAILANGNFEVPIITMFYASFSVIALPSMIAAFNKNEIKLFYQIRHAYQKEISVLLFPIVIALIFWATPIIRMVFGEAYTESGKLFAICAISFFIRFSSHHDVFLASKKTKYISIIQGVELIFHIALCYFLIKNLGMIGSSIGFVITNFIYLGVTAYYSARITKVSIWKVFPILYLLKTLFIATLILIPFYFIQEYFIYSDIESIVLASFYVFTSIFILYFISKRNDSLAVHLNE